MKFVLKSLLTTALAIGSVTVSAAVVQIEDANSSLYASTFGQVRTITFSEQAALTNPTYAADGNSAGVSFGSFFAGQSLGDATSCPNQISQCVLGAANPSAGVLTAAGVTPVIRNDGDRTVLASSAALTTGLPIAILFSEGVSAFSFNAGGFNNIGNTLVEVFSTTGERLAFTSNPGTCANEPCPPNAIDPQFFTFAFFDNAGLNSIRGVLISLTGVEEEGFAIDDLRSVVASSSGGGGNGGTNPPPTPPGGAVPEPGSLALVGLALLGLSATRRRFSRG